MIRITRNSHEVLSETMDLSTRWQRPSPKHIFTERHTRRSEGARAHPLPASFFSSQGLVDLVRESEGTSSRRAKGVQRRAEGQLKDHTVFPPGIPPGNTVYHPSLLPALNSPVAAGISRPSAGRHGNRFSSKAQARRLPEALA